MTVRAQSNTAETLAIFSDIHRNFVFANTAADATHSLTEENVNPLNQNGDIDRTGHTDRSQSASSNTEFE